MTCQAYYDTHPEPSGSGDRCSVREIEASTAWALALLGASTTFFGVANLFITGHGIKRFGVKAALVLQVFWPAARLGIQSIGVTVGGSLGIVIVQLSQIITIVGGPSGYLLALNTYVAEVASQREKTGYLGRLQGCGMFGSAIGMLAGGILGDAINILAPFQLALSLFVASTLYVLLALPYIPPIKELNPSSKTRTGLSRVFGPLRSLFPAKWALKDGRIRREYGPLILASGVFMAILATGYIPTLLQMTSQSLFGFRTTRNSYLVSMHLFLRGVFLMFAFPRIIAAGRRLLERRSIAKLQVPSPIETSDPDTPSEQGQITRAIQDEEHNVLPPKSSDEQETFDFDLIFTRFSLLVDGTLTLGATFVQHGWQMYLVAAFLPLGAGTGSGAKGVILQMCPASERTDALSAIALVEMIARLSTTLLFGLIFGAFANIGKIHLVFTCNAGVALLGFFVLLFSRFPPKGSVRLDQLPADDHADERDDQ